MSWKMTIDLACCHKPAAVEASLSWSGCKPGKWFDSLEKHPKLVQDGDGLRHHCMAPILRWSWLLNGDPDFCHGYLAARKRCLDPAYLHYWLWHYRNLAPSLRLFNSVLRQRRTYQMALAMWSLNCLTGMNACQQQPQNLYNFWSSTVTNFRLVMQQSRPGSNAAEKQPDDTEASGHSALVVQIISTICSSWLSMLKFKV